MNLETSKYMCVSTNKNETIELCIVYLCWHAIFPLPYTLQKKLLQVKAIEILERI